jgi:hypothetical protein
MEWLTKKIDVNFSHYFVRTAFTFKYSSKNRNGKPDLVSDANESIPSP